MEIISALGSPKSIAKDLVSQMKEKDENKQFKNSKFTDNISDKYEQSKIKARDIFRKGKNYVSEKLTPNLYSESSRLSTKLIKIILKILSLVLLMPAFMFIVVMIPIGISLIMSLVAFIVAIPLVVNFVWSVPEITAVVIFASILFIGCEIIAWQIFIFFIRLFIKLSKRYMNWIKTRNIYINASEKKDRLEKDSYEEDGKGDDDYE